MLYSVTAPVVGADLPSTWTDGVNQGLTLSGTVLRGNRTTSSSTTTTEIGVLRVDNISIVSGRLYAIHTSPLALTSTVNSDVVRATIRASTSGQATTSSTTVDILQLTFNSSGGPAVPLVCLYPTAANATLSVILTVGRVAGTGSVSIGSGSIDPIDMWIEDIGVDPGNSGVSL